MYISYPAFCLVARTGITLIMYLTTLYWIISIWLIYSLPRVPKESCIIIQLGDGFCIQLVPFYLSYVGTGKPTKTLCVTVHAPMTSLKVSIINFISWTESWLLKVFFDISVTRALSRTSWMFVVKQVPVCNFILLIFACVVLRKVHVHSLFTFETVVFPECLLFLDSDKKLNQ